MTLTERLAQAQAQQKQIEQTIDYYQQEIERLAPQLWAAKGRTSLLIEMVQEDERPAAMRAELADEEPSV